MELKTKFKTYTHNLAIIYSHLEGQYPYDIIQDENYVILMTSFDYHYVTGEVPKDDTKFIRHITTYIKENNKKECVFFAPSKTWEEFLESMIKALNGVVDYRYQYHLDSHRFMAHASTDASCILEDIKTDMSQKPLHRARIKKDGRIVSHATALMTGLNHVEIDISTEVSYRQKGFAYRVSKTLIYDLIKQDFIPEWNCWKIKTASRKLAEKLGFTLEKVIPAYVWVDAFKSYN